MAAELQFVENPTVTVAPPPNRGGRYRIELRSAPWRPPCGHHAQQALLWLTFVEGGQEIARELADVICAACEPTRYARVRNWADGGQ